MSRRFTLVTVVLAAVVVFPVGAIFAGGITQSSVAVGADKVSTRGISPAIGQRKLMTVDVGDR